MSQPTPPRSLTQSGNAPARPSAPLPSLSPSPSSDSPPPARPPPTDVPPLRSSTLSSRPPLPAGPPPPGDTPPSPKVLSPRLTSPRTLPRTPTSSASLNVAAIQAVPSRPKTSAPNELPPSSPRVSPRSRTLTEKFEKMEDEFERMEKDPQIPVAAKTPLDSVEVESIRREFRTIEAGVPEELRTVRVADTLSSKDSPSSSKVQRGSSRRPPALSKSKPVLIEKKDGSYESKKLTLTNAEALPPSSPGQPAGQDPPSSPSSSRKLTYVNREYLKDYVNFFTKDYRLLKFKDSEFRGMNGIKDDSGDALSDILYPIDLADYEEGLQGKENLFAPFIEPNNGFDNLHRLALDGVMQKREKLFSAMSMIPPADPLDLRYIGKPFSEQSSGRKLHLSVDSFDFKAGPYEPFFFTLAIYDYDLQVKVSEDFDFDFNNDDLLKMLGKAYAPREPESSAKQCIFDLPMKSRHQYLVLTISRVIQGEGDDKDINRIYMKHDEAKPKHIDKFKEDCQQRVDLLARYRQPFAFACIQLFDSQGKLRVDGQHAIDNIRLLKFEEDIFYSIECLQENFLNLRTLPAKLNITLTTLSSKKDDTLIGRIDTMYNKVRPMTDKPVQIIKELAAFKPRNFRPEPIASFVSNLYFYPTTINLRKYSSTQKGADVNARTIAIEVRLLSDDSAVDAAGLCDIYGDSTGPAFVTTKYTKVQYHNQRPVFLDEIKIRLPVEASPKCHLLVSFYHVKCEVGKAKAAPETLLARTFVPIFPNGRIIRDGEHNTPVFFDLAPGYLTADQDDANTFEHGRETLSFSVRSISSVHPQDDLLEDLFENQSGDNVDKLSQALENLQGAKLNEASVITHFVPLVDTLLRIIATSKVNVHKLQCFVVLVAVVDSVFQNASQKCLLESYAQFHFENFPGASNLPDELVDTWLKYSSIDHKHLAARHCWFFFSVMFKSMTLNLKAIGGFGQSRKGQASKSFYQTLQKLMYKMAEFINKALVRRMNVEIANFTNIHIAFFLRDLLSIGHRGYIFAIIETYADVFSLDDLNTTEAKLRFLKIVCDHEHYLALNLPTIATINARLMARIHETFAKQHFLAGLLLNQLKESVPRSAAIKNLSISVIRDLMWKHDNDPRYDHPDLKRRLAQLYFPIVTLVIDYRDDVLDSTLLSAEDVRNWLICFLFVLKNIDRDLLRNWWQRDAEKRKLGLLDVLSKSLEHFKYVGADELRKGVGLLNTTASISFDIMTYRSANLRDNSTRTLQKSPSFNESAAQQAGAPQTPTSSVRGSPSPASQATLSRLDTVRGDAIESSDSGSSSNLNRAVSLDSSKRYRDIVRRMRDQKNGVERRDRRRGPLRSYKNCFIASELIDWLVNEKEASTREDALRMGADMLQSGMLVSAQDESATFKDNGGLFRFTADEEQNLDRGNMSLALPQEESEHQAYLEAYYSERGNYPKSESRVLRRKGWIKERNLAQETSLLVLQLVLEFTVDHRQEMLRLQNADRGAMTDLVFRVLIDCLRLNQSVEVYGHVFRSLHVFLPLFNKLVFRARNSFIADLLYEILKECNSKSALVRSQAAGLIVLFVRNNFMEMRRISRVKLHMSTAISRLFGPHLLSPTEKDFVFMKNALKAIAVFCQGEFTEQSLDGIVIGKDVKDIVDRLFSLIDNNVHLEQYSFDGDTRAGYYYKMSLDYLDSPDLRITQLDKLASLQETLGNAEASAMVKLLSACLVGEYLRLINRALPYLPPLSIYLRVFPSLEKELLMPKVEELTVLGDEICQGFQFSEQGYISYVNGAIKNFLLADLFESAVEAYNLLMPIYIFKRDYKQQASSYTELRQLCNSIVKETGRMFAMYYRVLFFSPELSDLKALHKKEYIYKTAPTLRLAEFKESLKKSFEKKVGTGNVEFLSNIKTIEEDKLERGKVHLQVISVLPFFSDDDKAKRPTQYLQNFDIQHFIYETPFTKDGGAAYTEDPSKQWKRKTILTMARAYPYVGTRVEVTSKRDIELSPIETATENINNKIQDLQNELGFVLDLKTLAIQLHGTLLTQVNAGPLAVAKIFIAPETRGNFDLQHVKTLQDAFVKFVQLLADALSKQKPLIDTTQLAVQTELERQYFVFKSEVCRLTGANPDQFTESFFEPPPLDESNPALITTLTPSRDSVPISSSKGQSSPSLNTTGLTSSAPRRLSTAVQVPSAVFTSTKSTKQ